MSTMLNAVLQDSSEALELTHCISACNILFYSISDLNDNSKSLIPN